MTMSQEQLEAKMRVAVKRGISMGYWMSATEGEANPARVEPLTEAVLADGAKRILGAVFKDGYPVTMPDPEPGVPMGSLQRWRLLDRAQRMYDLLVSWRDKLSWQTQRSWDHPDQTFSHVPWHDLDVATAQVLREIDMKVE